MTYKHTKYIFCLFAGDWIIREGTVGNKMYFIQVINN